MPEFLSISRHAGSVAMLSSATAKLSTFLERLRVHVDNIEGGDYQRTLSGF
jgi:hypothetical protein